MKNLISIIVLSLSVSSTFAQNEHTCLQQTEQRLQQEASNTTDWTFDGLSLVPQAEVNELVDNAIPQDYTTYQLEALKDKAQLPENEIFVFHWLAPSNSGSTLIIINKLTCAEVDQILLYSEE